MAKNMRKPMIMSSRARIYYLNIKKRAIRQIIQFIQYVPKLKGVAHLARSGPTGTLEQSVSDVIINIH